jgi:4-amino-4-deoxychorismate lyase
VPDLRVVALLGAGVVPADTPILRADDLGAVRGDGIFETMHVRGGQAWLLDEHLSRMERSAALMELPLPRRETVAELAEQALAAWPANQEGALRLVCTRGSEIAPGPATVFATINPVPAAAIRARAEGVAVRTASLGVPADLRNTAPWLLGGAKTLSYAVNMASLRWAQAAGADDTLWLSSDGYALEAPTSTLVWLEGSILYSVPAEPTGILAGTTARWLLEHAGELDLTAERRMVTPAELSSCDGVWFTSSVRGPVAIRRLDDAITPYDPALTAKLQAYLGFA